MQYLSLLIAGFFAFINIAALANNIPHMLPSDAQESLKKIERSFNGKIGVYAINTGNNQVIAYRANERFPVQSTIKLLSVGALFSASQRNKNLLQEKIFYTRSDLNSWHPITGKYVASGMTLAALAKAAMIYSDNPAVNLIIKKLGGPAAITNFAHTIGNQSFNIEHYDGNLNSNPNNLQDTATPKDMAMSVRQLTLGNVLSFSQRALLINWMRDSRTGDARIRAGVPPGWMVADKTGSGDYGIANDIGLVWAPNCKPIVIAIYTVQHDKLVIKRETIVASIAKAIFVEFAKNDACLNAPSELCRTNH